MAAKVINVLELAIIVIITLLAFIFDGPIEKPKLVPRRTTAHVTTRTNILKPSLPKMNLGMLRGFVKGVGQQSEF